MLVYFVNHSSAMDHLGGSERSMLKLVEDWVAADPALEPFFLTKRPEGLFVAEIVKRGWRYESFPFRGWAIPQQEPTTAELAYFARDDYSATTGMLQVMRDRQPDLVVTNTVVAPWGAFAAKLLGIPHAWFIREYGDLDHGLNFQHGRAQTFADMGLLSEAVFANSNAIKQHAAQYLPAEKVTVVYPQLDIPDFAERAAAAPEVTPFPHADAGLKITAVGRLAPSKGQWRVVEALGVLHARGVAASVCFVGAKMEADHDLKLMKRARELGVADRIVFAGEQPNPLPYATAADVCVTPSGNEAFGRTTLEYLTIGRPVVATRSGGSTELIDHGVNGFLFAPDDTDAMADHLQHYIDNPADLAAHGEAARAKAAWSQSAEFGNGAAIERLRALVDLDADQIYRLPAVAEYWMRFPEQLSPESGNAITFSYLRSRLFSKARNFLRHPIASVRRRLRR